MIFCPVYNEEELSKSAFQICTLLMPLTWEQNCFFALLKSSKSLLLADSPRSMKFRKWKVFPKVLCGVHSLLLQSLLLPSLQCHLTFQQSTAWHSDHMRHSVTQASKLMAWETCYLLPLICHNICQVSMWLIFELFLLYPTNIQGLLLKNSASWLLLKWSACSGFWPCFCVLLTLKLEKQSFYLCFTLELWCHHETGKSKAFAVSLG